MSEEKEYPKNLMEVKVWFAEVMDTEANRIDDQNGNMYEVSWKAEDLYKAIKALQMETLHKEWYRGQGPSYWCGILSAYPWESCPGDDEEYIWMDLIKYHLAMRNGNLVFRYCKESPIDVWLHKHTSDGDTPINVETVFKHAMETAIKLTNGLFTFTEREASNG